MTALTPAQRAALVRLAQDAPSPWTDLSGAVLHEVGALIDAGLVVRTVRAVRTRRTEAYQTTAAGRALVEQGRAVAPAGSPPAPTPHAPSWPTGHELPAVPVQYRSEGILG